MIIGLNGQKLLTKSPAGPERYTLSLYKALAGLDKTNQYIIYLENDPTEFPEVKYFEQFPNFRLKQLTKIVSWTHISLLLELLRNPVDVFFSPVHTLPFIKTFGTKYVSMIHGLEYKSNEIYSTLSARGLLHPFVLWYTMLIADLIIVPSRFTKKAVKTSRLLQNMEKVKVIYEGVNDTFYKRNELEISEIKSKYGLSGKNYVIFVSTIQPRKNIPNLVKGFSMALESKNELKETILVIVGEKGWSFEESIAAPTKYNVVNNVKFLGWVDQSDLPTLMSGAAAYVMPSFEEGFSLTILEAMASEVPVIASDIETHKEIGNNYCNFVNPNSPEEIKKALIKVLTGQVEANRIENAKNYARSFTWKETAMRTLSAFESLLA